MDEIRALLRIAAARLHAGTLLEKAHRIALLLGGAAVLLVILDRLGAEAMLPWHWLAPLLAAAGAAAAILLWRRACSSDLHIAALVDERLELREKLTTALQVRDEDDPFAHAAVEDAVCAARDPRNHELARRRFTVAAPRGWWGGPLLLLIAIMIAQMQPLDLFAREAPEQREVVQARHDVDEALESIVRSIEDQPELSSELSDLLGELTAEPADRDALRSPENVRRDAIKRITELNQRLEELMSGERGKTVDALDRAMKQLRPPKDGPGKDLAEAMSRGDFTAAKKALQELIEKIDAGELTPEQQARLAEQLQELARQLEELAARQEQLEDALRQAGMDPQLAQNPEALQEAIENHPDLNEQQRRQLQQMAQAQQAASEMCRGLGQAAAAMAQGIEAGELGGAGALGEQLSQIEQMQMLLRQARAASEACQGSSAGLGQGLGMQAAMNRWMAMQAMGEGRVGGPRPVAPSPARTRDVQAHGQTAEGDIIARMLVDGPQVRGESVVAPSDVIAEVVEGLEEGLTEDQLPRKYHEAQKHYFGELERRTQAREEDEE